MAKEGLEALHAFDGKHVAGLKALVRAPLDDRDLLAELPGPHEIAASWVLKARLEDDGLSQEVRHEVYKALPLLTEPDAVLHLLQMVQHAPFASVDSVRSFLDHKRTLVRVWALDALARVSPDEAKPLVEVALEDPFAAMRARARAIVERLD